MFSAVMVSFSLSSSNSFVIRSFTGRVSSVINLSSSVTLHGISSVYSNINNYSPMQFPVIAISHIIKTELTINTKKKALNRLHIQSSNPFVSETITYKHQRFLKIWPCLGSRESSWFFCSSSISSHCSNGL